MALEDQMEAARYLDLVSQVHELFGDLTTAEENIKFSCYETYRMKVAAATTSIIQQEQARKKSRSVFRV
jgi:hypothetical protein